MTSGPGSAFCCRGCRDGEEHDESCRGWAGWQSPSSTAAVPTAASEATFTASGRWTSEAPDRYNTEPEAAESSVVDNGADNGADDGDEPEVVRPATLGVRLNGTLLCSVGGCCRPSLMTAHFVDGTMALVCCELCVAGDGHTAECDAASALWQRRQQRMRQRQQPRGQEPEAAPTAAAPTAAAPTAAARTAAAPIATAPTADAAAPAAKGTRTTVSFAVSGARAAPSALEETVTAPSRPSFTVEDGGCAGDEGRSDSADAEREAGVAWTPRHQELKEALLSSKALKPLERSGSDVEALDFVRHVVIEVEQRGDHGLLGKPLATEVDWEAWVRRIVWLAAQNGRHLECAVRLLKLEGAVDLAGIGDQRGSGVVRCGSDAIFPARWYSCGFHGRRLDSS